MRLPRIVEPLRHRDFRLLWTGQTLTLLGSFVSNIAYLSKSSLLLPSIRDLE
jgi:hypothetical protein